MSVEDRPASVSICFSIDQIPSSGMRIAVSERIEEVLKATGDESMEGLKQSYRSPVVGELQVFRVGSKVDIRGKLKTEVSGICDFCGCDMTMPLAMDFNLFLMPLDQFSEHDKPGGRLIFSPVFSPVFSKGNSSSSKKLNRRERKKKKRESFQERPGEHEDASFGSFDGQKVNLYPHLKEGLILNLPMSFQCQDCRKTAQNSPQRHEERLSHDSGGIGGLSGPLSELLGR